ncbi:hypothetical protein ABBQ32_011296 [Trebouxia sp. C0010 RCD-2024]
MREDIIKRAAQVIALQQKGQAIEPMRTGPHDQREAKYKAVITNLLTLDCTSLTAVSGFLTGLSSEQ